MPPSPYARSRAHLRAIQDGLSDWGRRVMREAGLDNMEVRSDFPAKGSSAPFIVLFPYRLGPEPALVSTARPASLLGWSVQAVPQGLPAPWGRVGALVTAALRHLWPAHPDRPRSAEIPAAAPLASLGPALAAWYTPRDEWRLPTGEARLPSLWWTPGVDLGLHYVFTGGGGSRGTVEDDGGDSPLLVGAAGAFASAVAIEGGFDVELPPYPDDAGLGDYCRALAADLRAGVATAAPRRVEDPTGLADALDEVAAWLGKNPLLEIGVFPSHDLSNQELYSFMQAVQRPLKVSSFYRLQVRLADAVVFSPSLELRMRHRHVAQVLP